MNATSLLRLLLAISHLGPALGLSVAYKLRVVYGRVERDFRALQTRSTTYHIMRPRSEEGQRECVEIKRVLRNAVADEEAFVVDAFMKAAEKVSLDANTAKKGGLLGERLPQGSLKHLKEIDRAMFTAPLGVIYGPIESEHGNHLVLVEERIGCESLDRGFTRVEAEHIGPGVRSSLRGPRETGDGVTGSYIFYLCLLAVGGELAMALSSFLSFCACDTHDPTSYFHGYFR